MLVQNALRQATPYRLEVCGELMLNSSTKVYNHLYARLRDNNESILELTWFNGKARADALGIRNGDKVVARGSLGFYPKSGRLQFIAESLRPVNDEDTLTKLLHELIAKLAKEGLLDASRKKPIPRFPRRIGVVSSIDAAGFRDFIHTSLSRYKGLSFLVAPSRVQGSEAAAELCNGVRLLDEYGGCDVIVVTRGGGGTNELWCFNDETLARTIAAARTPVITAVGHERDTTLVDYVADRCETTPTKAAETLTQPFVEILQRVENDLATIRQSILAKAANLRTRLNACLGSNYLLRPKQLIDDRQLRLVNAEQQLMQALPNQARMRRAKLDNAINTLTARINAFLQGRRGEFERLDNVLRALDPKGVLKRGYSILLDKDKHAIRKETEAPEGTRLTALLAEGSLELVVKQDK